MLLSFARISQKIVLRSLLQEIFICAAEFANCKGDAETDFGTQLIYYPCTARHVKTPCGNDRINDLKQILQSTVYTAYPIHTRTS
jgi:hypothetical protein